MKALDYIKVVRSKEEIIELLSRPGLGVALLRILEKQFGCGFGTSGFLAGQSVSSAIDEYLGLSEGLQYSDLDVFSKNSTLSSGDCLTAENLHTSFIMQQFKNWLRKSYPHLSEDTFEHAANDIRLRSEYLAGRASAITFDMLERNRLSMSGVEAVEASDIFNYTALVEGGLQRASYKITGIYNEGFTQHIFHTGITRDIYSNNGSCLMTPEELACFAVHRSLAPLYTTDTYEGKGILQGFDINSIQVGISLRTGSIIYTDNYVQYLHNRQLHIVSSTTPFQSMVRALKKYQHGTCFFNKEEYLDVLRHVLAYRIGEPLGCYIKGYEVGSIYKERLAVIKEFSNGYYTLKDSDAKWDLNAKCKTLLNNALKKVLPEGLSDGEGIAPLGGQGLITTHNRVSCLSEENKEWLSTEIELHPIKGIYVLPVLKHPEKLDSWKQIGLRVPVHPSLTPKNVSNSLDGSEFTLEQGTHTELIPVQEIIGLSHEEVSAKIEALGNSAKHYIYGLGSAFFPNMPEWNAIHCMIKLSQHKKVYRDTVFDMLLRTVSRKASISYDLSLPAKSYFLWKAAYDNKLPASLEKLASLPKSKYGIYGWYSGECQNEEMCPTYRRKLTDSENHTLEQLYRHMLNKGRYPNLERKSPEELLFRQEVETAFISWMLQEEKHLNMIGDLLAEENPYGRYSLMALCPEVESLLELRWEGLAGFERVDKYMKSVGKETELLTLPAALMSYPTHEVHAKVDTFVNSKLAGKSGVDLLIAFFSALLSIALSRAYFRLSTKQDTYLRFTKFNFTDDVLAACVRFTNSVERSSAISASDLRIAELVLPVELLVEGREMSHCVGGYSSAIKRGNTRILAYSLKKNSKVYRATAELRLTNQVWTTIQIRSKRNEDPISELKAVHQYVVMLLSEGMLPEEMIELPEEEATSPYIAAERELQLLA